MSTLDSSKHGNILRRYACPLPDVMAVCVCVREFLCGYLAAIVSATVLFGTVAILALLRMHVAPMLSCIASLNSQLSAPPHAGIGSCSSCLGCHVGTFKYHSYVQSRFLYKAWLPELQLGACWQWPLLVDRSVNDTRTFCILVDVQ